MDKKIQLRYRGGSIVVGEIWTSLNCLSDFVEDLTLEESVIVVWRKN